MGEGYFDKFCMDKIGIKQKIQRRVGRAVVQKITKVVRDKNIYLATSHRKLEIK